jgi:hypothetical protein
MVEQAVAKEWTLVDVAERVIADLQERFPAAKFLLNDEVYGDEDLYIDIYVDEDEVLVLDRFANELTYRYWENTGYDIMPMVAPRDCYPIKE